MPSPLSGLFSSKASSSDLTSFSFTPSLLSPQGRNRLTQVVVGLYAFTQVLAPVAAYAERRRIPRGIAQELASDPQAREFMKVAKGRAGAAIASLKKGAVLVPKKRKYSCSSSGRKKRASWR